MRLGQLPFSPRLIQARWVLGKLPSEEVSQPAQDALEIGHPVALRGTTHKWWVKVVLFSVLSVAVVSEAQFSRTAPSLAQETQARGYWTDPSNGLTWAAKDNGKRVSWHKATRYCHKLRLAGYSDWRLATIDELESLVNLKAYATEHVGSSDILHWNSDLQVSGGLLLTGDRQWSSSPLIDVNGRSSTAHFWSFDFRTGRRWIGFEDIAEGDTMYALCVRESKASPVPTGNIAMQGDTPSPAANQHPAKEQQSPAYWTDPSTGLTWTAKDNGNDVNLAEAIKYCRDLRLGQSSDWRLATIEELEALRRPKTGATDPIQQKDSPTAYRLPEEISLTGVPWSSSPASEAQGDFAIEWYLSLESKTRVFDEPSYRHAKRALCVRNSFPKNSSQFGESSSNDRSSAGEQGSPDTQQLGYWIDPGTGLMWAGRDNFHNFIIYSEATRYCQDLRLAHYSDWRLATIDELQGIYDPRAASPGANPRSHDHEPEPRFFHVKGNLFLTGMQWGSTTGTNPSENVGVFNFQDGSVVTDKLNYVREKRALCVRRSSK